MAIGTITARASVPLVAARATASAAPTPSDDGFVCGADGGLVRTFVKYTGAVTAAVLRLWVHDPTADVWFKGASTTDLGPLAPTTDGAESRDWIVGEGAEFVIQLESISPSGGAPTVAVAAMGVDR